MQSGCKYGGNTGHNGHNSPLQDGHNGPFDTTFGRRAGSPPLIKSQLPVLSSMSIANAERRALPIELVALAKRQGDYIFIEGYKAH